jgi:uncharacterized membrane protein YbjE (DUF340 family)
MGALIFCWDGLLPLVVVLTPIIVKSAFPKWEAGFIFVGIFAPIGAFAARFLIGYVRMRKETGFLLQNLAFVAAVILLFIGETILSVDHLDKRGPKIANWSTLLFIYLAYLGFMAIALFPARVE